MPFVDQTEAVSTTLAHRGDAIAPEHLGANGLLGWHDLAVAWGRDLSVSSFRSLLVRRGTPSSHGHGAFRFDRVAFRPRTRTIARRPAYEQRIPLAPLDIIAKH